MYHRSLYTFLTVAEEGSFLQAAKKLYLTPASVMNQINTLEAQVGAKLVLRSSQGTSLTPAGRGFYEDAKGLIQAADRAVQRARQVARQEKTTIRVGTSLLRPCKPLMTLLTEMDHGDLPFQITLVPFDETPAGMQAMPIALGKEIDCFVSPCASPRWLQTYGILPLCMSPSCLAVPRGHRLAKRKSLTWDDLEGESLILVRQGGSVVLDRLRQEIQREHPGIRIVDVPPFHSMDAFNLCERMQCVMELPANWAEIHPALVTLPMDWDYQVAYGIVYAKEPSEAVSAFLRWVRPLIAAHPAPEYHNIEARFQQLVSPA